MAFVDGNHVINVTIDVGQSSAVSNTFKSLHKSLAYNLAFGAEHTKRIL